MDALTDIRLAEPFDPQVEALVQRHIHYGNQHYPVESNHHMTASEMVAAGVELFVAWRDRECVGIAGLKKLNPAAGELKAMHVTEAARGLGVGAALFETVIAQAQMHRLTSLWLETGSREASASARRLYERLGFTYCPPFGDYVEDPESVFMTKPL